MEKEILKFIENMSYCLPYTENDMVRLVELTHLLTLEKIKRNMVGMSVNGTMQTILTEQKLKELIDGYKPVNIENVREVCKEKRIR